MNVLKVLGFVAVLSVASIAAHAEGLDGSQLLMSVVK